MNYVEKVLDGVYNVLNVNAATLSGAIDIIVVPQEDGSLKSTPFHVRFGKMQSFVADEKIVSIFVNDELVDLKMKLGKAGEAYFIEDLPEDESDFEPKENLKKSSNSIPSSASMDSKLDSVTNESEDLSQWLAVNEGPVETTNSVVTTKVVTPTSDSTSVSADPTATTITTTTTTTTPIPPPPTWQWSWGMFPTFKFRKRSPPSVPSVTTPSLTATTTTTTTLSIPAAETPSITSSDKIEDSSNIVPSIEEDPLIVGTTPIFAGTEEPTTTAIFEPNTSSSPSSSAPIAIPLTSVPSQTASLPSSFSPSNSESNLTMTSPTTSSLSSTPTSSTMMTSSFPSNNSNMKESKPKISFSSPTLTPESLEYLQSSKLKVEFSRCAKYLGNSVEEIQEKLIQGYRETDMIFHEHRISQSELIKDPSILYSPQVLIKIQNQIYPVSIGFIQLMSLLAFHSFLPSESLSSFVESNPSLSLKASVISSSSSIPSSASKSDKKWSKLPWRWGSTNPTTNPTTTTNPATNPTHSLKEKDLVEALGTKSGNSGNNNVVSGTVSLPTSPVAKRAKRTFKTLRPSSDDLTKMKLKAGSNQIRFRISSFRGQTEVRAHVFLWEKDSKIVISDIDGTITKSDVFGQILPFLGRDWSHSGIVKLYSTIKLNNYHVLYLSARAIGQANSTRGYVTTLKQGEQIMPMGPVFLSPTRLLSSFNQEVIQRTPQKFKIECLKDVQSLFPINSQPFYAGFGNRMTDAISYEAVGIPNGKIFTINPKGEISIANSAVTKSFKTLNELVEHMFPPNTCTIVSEEWNNFNFWKPPPPSLDQ